MKARPRATENGIARELNKVLADLNYDKIERIPVLGRTGPDLTINQLGLVIDVKSRKSCPKGIMPDKNEIKSFEYGGMTFWAVRVSDVRNKDMPIVAVKGSKMIYDWWMHMDEWTQEKTTGKTTCIITHKPKIPYGNAAAIFKSIDLERLMEKL